MKTRLAIALAVAAFGMSLPTYAQECLLGPALLPGLSGPPAWLNPGGGGAYRPELHDPRWSGSPLRLHQFSDTIGHYEEGAYRVLESGGYLYVSVQALADGNGLGTSDRVYFALTQGSGGNGGWAVRIDGDVASAVEGAPPSGPNDSPAKVAASRIRAWNTADATVASPSWTVGGAGNIPTWLDQVAVWRTSPGVAWAVTFRVKISDLGVSGPFKVFHGLRVDHGGVTGVVNLGSSSISGTFLGTAGETVIPISSAAWTSQLDAGAAVCASGITFSSTNVGVNVSGSLTSQVNACGSAADPCPAAPGTQTNQFRVQPQNVPDPSGAQHTIRARMRIADWGSTYANWDDAPWNDIPNLNVPPNVFTRATSALTSDANWGFSWSGGVATIDYTCVAAAGDYCPKLTNADGEDHQCMLVELAADPSNNNDPAYFFARNAVYRNMNFLGLSTAKVPATIDISGMASASGGAIDRDVYLIVQALNMPKHGNTPIFQDHEQMAAAAKYAEVPPPVPPQADGRDLRRNYTGQQLEKMRKQRGYIAEASKRATAQAQAIAAFYKQQGKTPGLLDAPTLSGEQAMASAWPTYQVHVYYDTGKKTKNDDGTERRVLSPMTHFGFYLKHNGPLYGFSHELEAAPGTTLEKLEPNVYRIRIKKDGKARISTVLTAHEEGIGKTECDCDKCCAKKDHTHEHGKVPPHKHCACSTPGFAERGSSALAWALGLLALVFVRRRFAA